MTALFSIALKKQDNSIVDIGWGIGFILIALYTLLANNLFLPRHLVATALVCLWGIRIAIHICTRNWGKSEDPRYAAWRKQWGNWTIVRSFLHVFVPHGLGMFIVATPIVAINMSTATGLGVLDIIGLLFWIIGFAFESISDYQLYRFTCVDTNRGMILTTGLWRYSRHPNYFGECIMWWSVWLIALSVPYGLYTIISPLLLSYLLISISGIPIIEDLFKDDPAYQAYKKQTSSFFPWFPTK